MDKPAIHVALYQPEIPPNTGNIIRLCANSGSQLHLICPLGFELTDKRLKRAGLDYAEYANIVLHEDFEQFMLKIPPHKVLPCTTKGGNLYSEIRYSAGDCLLFGPETKGLPESVLKKFDINTYLRIPMQETSRSLNLSNSVAIIVYEALRQNAFFGLT